MKSGCYAPYMWVTQLQCFLICSGKPLSIVIVMYYDIYKLLENYEMPAPTLFYYYCISFLISSTITRPSSPLPNNVHRRYSYPCAPVTGTWWMLAKVKLKVWVQHFKYFMNIMCDMASLKLWMQLIKVDLPHGVSFVCSVYHTANACIHGISLFSLCHSQIWWWVEASLRLHR